MSERTDRLAYSIAVDGTAARVTGRGVHYDPKMRTHATEALIGMPPILRPVKQGKRMGLWVILGLAAESPTSSPKRPGALFVVKCSCGRYGLRDKKALYRARTERAGCPECKHFHFVKRQFKKSAAIAKATPPSDAARDGAERTIIPETPHDLPHGRARKLSVL